MSNNLTLKESTIRFLGALGIVSAGFFVESHLSASSSNNMSSETQSQVQEIPITRIQSHNQGLYELQMYSFLNSPVGRELLQASRNLFADTKEYNSLEQTLSEEEKLRPEFYDNSMPYLGEISTVRDFFLLSEYNLAARILLLEDDTGANTWDIATTMFQRAKDRDMSLCESLTNGSYSGVNYSKRQVPSRALNDSYTDEQILEVYDMITRLINHEGEYRTDGGDSFFHRDIPVKTYSKEDLLYLANVDGVFRETYNLPSGSKERIVEVIPHSVANGKDKVMFIYDAH